MDNTNSAVFQVIDARGVRGYIDLTAAQPQGNQSRLVLVRFEDGSHLYADAGNFTEREEGIFSFPGSFAELLAQNQKSNQGEVSLGETSQLVIPLIAEELRIDRKQIVTGGVRVHKTVAERVETIDEPVLREDVNIERVPVNQFIAEAPAVRYEGEVMIVPLLEEVFVVEKRLMLREEIRISKRRETVQKPQEVVLRREEATLEQIRPDTGQINARPVNE